MSRRRVDPARACIPLAEWPEADRLAWAKASQPRHSPFREDGGGFSRNPATLRKTLGGYRRWLGYLKLIGALDPAVGPAQRPTPERLDLETVIRQTA
jgi:hypothetical protein